MLMLQTGCREARQKPKQFPFFRQTLPYDCAPTSLKMIYAYYGETYSKEELMRRLKTSRKGTSLKAMADLSKELGYVTMLVSVSTDFIQQDIKLPCIVDWNGNHAVVVYKADSSHIYVADPADTLITYDRDTFMKGFLNNSSDERGIALVVYKL